MKLNKKFAAVGGPVEDRRTGRARQGSTPAPAAGLHITARLLHPTHSLVFLPIPILPSSPAKIRDCIVFVYTEGPPHPLTASMETEKKNTINQATHCIPLSK